MTPIQRSKTIATVLHTTGTPCLLAALVAGLVSALAGQLTAQTFTTLHSFTDLDGWTSGTGYFHARLLLSGDALYGVMARGGTSDQGTIFALNTDGTGFNVLYNFSGYDGAVPLGGLALSGSVLYGTTYFGGDYDNGTIFAVNTDGSGFATLYSFSVTPSTGPYTNSDGANPSAPLLVVGNTLYGTATAGGDAGSGTVFAINGDGTGFTNLHDFSGRDGASLRGAGLVQSGNTLFGPTFEGGAFGHGTIFAMNIDATGFKTIHNFGGSDGDGPIAALLLSGNILYGTTIYGGTGPGTVFAVNTDGTSFKILHEFAGCCGPGRNADGEFPQPELILLGKTLFGTAAVGGTGGVGDGTVFAVNTDGTGFKLLHTFTATSGASSGMLGGMNSDGAVPYGGLVLSGNILYGTTSTGGTWGDGTVFSISLPPLPPQLSITPAGANVVLSWPTNALGFILQSTTNIGSSAVWNTNSPAPVVVNGQHTVTNPISGTQQLYRLSQ